MTDNSSNSKASSITKFRRRIARMPRPQVDNQGRPTTRMTYTYDDDGLLVEAKETPTPEVPQPR